jgi:hypothetical protein
MNVTNNMACIKYTWKNCNSWEHNGDERDNGLTNIFMKYGRYGKISKNMSLNIE